MEYRVEELSRAALVSVDTIRFYQSKRLLAPPRRTGRVAIYGDDHLERLREIRRLQERGFTGARNLKGGILAWIDRVDPTLPKY